MSENIGNENSHNNLELKNIFNLLNPNSEGEIEIKQINHLIQQLESLKYASRPSGIDSSEQSPSLTATQSDLKVTDKKPGQNAIITTSKAPQSLPAQKSNSSNGIAQTSAIKQPGQQDKDCIEILELRYFPNNKTTLNFNDFCHYFNECITNKDLQEDLLQSCFNQFDFNEDAYINSKKIKSIFEIFNDKTNQEEIQNVLKFCGVTNDKMSYDEFKQFFEKNL